VSASTASRKSITRYSRKFATEPKQAVSPVNGNFADVWVSQPTVASGPPVKPVVASGSSVILT
jgi:hypothetical protein